MSLTSKESASATPLTSVAMETKDIPRQDQKGSDGLDKNLDKNSNKPESNKSIAAVQDVQQSQSGPGDGQC